MPKFRTGNTSSHGRRKEIPRRVFLAGAAIAAGGATAGWFASRRGTAKGGAAALAEGDLPRRGETRPTLEPARFRGAVRRAYQVARDLPALLDKLFCYCDCGKYFGHKSLLSCYVDTHAAG